MKRLLPIRFMVVAFAAIALAFSASATLVTVSSMEVWNGTTNPHSGDGVTISGSGSRENPYVYSIPDGMTITSSGLIRLSGDFSDLAETNSIVFQIPSGNLQIDSGGYIDCGTPTRTIKAKFTIDMIGGGSVTGAGKIIGMDKTRSTASSINSRSLFIINALNVTLADIDLHTENVAAGPFVSTITASGAVNITGTINTSDIEGASGSDGGGISIGGNSVTVHNIDTKSLRPTGNSGVITLQALAYLYGTYDPSYIGNAYANQLVVNGAINTAGAAVNGGGITMQGVVVRLDPGASITKVSGATLTLAAGDNTKGLPDSDLFINIAGTAVTPAYTVNWDGTPPTGSAPVFTSDPINGGSIAMSNAYSGTLAGSATDADSNPLTYMKGSGPAWLSVASNGAMSGTPLVADSGTNTFQVAVTDGTRYDIATLKIVVTAPPTAPVFTSSPVVKAQANSGQDYALKAQTLAGSAHDLNGDTLTFAKVSGPAWLTVASDGALGGTPTSGDIGVNSWSVSVSDGALSSTGTLQINVGGSPSLVTVSGVEVWNGSNNLHLAEGVTLSGSGTSTDPYVYAIPAGLRITSGSSIRLSASVDYSIVGNPDTNYITFKFTGGSFQIDSGGWLDVGFPSRNVTSRFLCDLSGGSITGTGKILGIDHGRNPLSGVNVRFVTITNATSVSLADVDMHVENLNTSSPDLRIYATNTVIVSGAIDTRYGLFTDAGNAGNCYIFAGFISVNNVDARALNGTGRNNGAISLHALNAAGGYSTGNGNNAYTNQIEIKGAVRTDGTNNDAGGNITLQSVVTRVEAGASISMATNGTLTFAVGTTNVSTPATSLFMNVGGATLGPSSTPLSPTYDVVWTGSAPNTAPFWLSSPVQKISALIGLNYSQKGQTLAGDAMDYQWTPLTFSKLSGPTWLSIASNGSLSGTPTESDAGTNLWQVSTSDGSLSATAQLQIVVASRVLVASTEVWNGSNNLHAAEGVTLTGSGTVSSPYLYTIPGGMRIAGGASIRLSASVDYDIAGNPDTNHIAFKFNGSNLQIDNGGWIDTGYGNRNVRIGFLCDLGGGSITGSGRIIGIDHGRNPGSGVNVRSVTITNVVAVALTDIDLHSENLNSAPPTLTVSATGSVGVSGNIQTYCLTGENQAGDCTIRAGFITVSNVDTRAVSGRVSGNIVMRALNAAAGWSASSANNAYTNQLIVNGPIQSDGGTSGGSVDLQQVVLRMATGSSLTPRAGGSLTLRVGTTSGGVPAGKLFMDVAATGLTPTYDVTWNGTVVGPYFLSSPIVKTDGREGVDYGLKAQTLAGDALDPQWSTKTFAKLSGPSWLAVASDGSLSGAPGAGDVGTNTWQVAVTASSLTATGTLKIIVVSYSTPMVIAGLEDWDGVNNPRAGDGVTLAPGSGTEADPAVYTIPSNMLLAEGGVIRMSPTTSDDRSITLQFTGGNLQMDNGSAINIARRNRNGREVAKFEMGGGSITGAGQIVGLLSSDNTPRVLFITNAANVHMKSIDLHVENVNNSGRNMRISASGNVAVGTIDNTDRDSGGGSGCAVVVEGGTLTMTNIYTFAMRSTSAGANGGEVLLRALAAPDYGTGNAVGNQYTNVMWVNGVIQVHTNLDIGNNVTLEGVRIQLGPAFNLITTTNYQVEEHAGVYPNSLGLTAADMFSNSSSVVLSPAYDVLWNNGLPPVTQPELFIARDGTNVTLTWGDGSFSLQSNTNVVSPTGWVDVPGTSPVQQPIGTQPAFFRLKK